jgi:hypothetical protein
MILGVGCCAFENGKVLLKAWSTHFCSTARSMARYCPVRPREQCERCLALTTAVGSHGDLLPAIFKLCHFSKFIMMLYCRYWYLLTTGALILPVVPRRYGTGTVVSGLGLPVRYRYGILGVQYPTRGKLNKRPSPTSIKHCRPSNAFSKKKERIKHAPPRRNKNPICNPIHSLSHKQTTFGKGQ